MHYNILLNSEKIGKGLSRGELNQWLLDTVGELTQDEYKKFRYDFGHFTEDSFEHFLYENELELPVIARFKDKYMVIEESEF